MEDVIVPAHKLTSYFIRDFNDHSIKDSLLQLSLGNWEEVFAGHIQVLYSTNS
jgi:hypothetical protein